MAETKVPPIVRLSYSKGEQIIKEGDYGSSIYKILSGRVRIFKCFGKDRTTLAILDRGDIFGEMTFFNLGLEPRFASAIAMDDAVLEVWHPARLSDEYNNMPPILGYIVQQSLKRLVRMNRIVDEMSSRKEAATEFDPRVTQRQYFRKRWDQEFTYAPLGRSKSFRFIGMIRDVSLNGVGVEVPHENSQELRHELGDEFVLNIQFTSGKTVSLDSSIKSVRRSITLGYLFLGLEFKNVSKEAIREISRFMMF
jgi:CRP/FNR family transcriptional regulator, cyclic AMP receptor protein